MMQYDELPGNKEKDRKEENLALKPVAMPRRGATLRSVVCGVYFGPVLD